MISISMIFFLVSSKQRSSLNEYALGGDDRWQMLQNSAYVQCASGIGKWIVYHGDATTLEELLAALEMHSPSPQFTKKFVQPPYK